MRLLQTEIADNKTVGLPCPAFVDPFASVSNYNLVGAKAKIGSTFVLSLTSR